MNKLKHYIRYFDYNIEVEEEFINTYSQLLIEVTTYGDMYENKKKYIINVLDENTNNEFINDFFKELKKKVK